MTDVSVSLAGTVGAVSVEGLLGPVLSLLLKKLPKIELLFVVLGAVSRVVVPAAWSVGAVAPVAAVRSVGPVASVGAVVPVEAVGPVEAVSPFVVAGLEVVLGSEPVRGTTGAPTTRAAEIQVSPSTITLDNAVHTNSGRIDRLGRSGTLLDHLIVKLDIVLHNLVLGFLFLLHILLHCLFFGLLVFLDLLLLIVFLLLPTEGSEDTSPLP